MFNKRDEMKVMILVVGCGKCMMLLIEIMLKLMFRINGKLLLEYYINNLC